MLLQALLLRKLPSAICPGEHSLPLDSHCAPSCSIAHEEELWMVRVQQCPRKHISTESVCRLITLYPCYRPSRKRACTRDAKLHTHTMQMCIHTSRKSAYTHQENVHTHMTQMCMRRQQNWIHTTQNCIHTTRNCIHTAQSLGTHHTRFCLYTTHNFCRDGAP